MMKRGRRKISSCVQVKLNVYTVMESKSKKEKKLGNIRVYDK